MMMPGAVALGLGWHDHARLIATGHILGHARGHHSRGGNVDADQTHNFRSGRFVRARKTLEHERHEKSQKDRNSYSKTRDRPAFASALSV
ncbi:hypothetical protein GCM10007207_26730 [Asaia siamensis]|uniref:Secreted protein n=1 Tax=Asaia siamensis TaxID=110479 RepID=A0ABQ1MGM9_9PROT|nr:hypothetical protein GCM10007207_26730 [Asaia siamensis]